MDTARAHMTPTLPVSCDTLCGGHLPPSVAPPFSVPKEEQNRRDFIFSRPAEWSPPCPCESDPRLRRGCDNHIGIPLFDSTKVCTAHAIPLDTSGAEFAEIARDFVGISTSIHVYRIQHTRRLEELQTETWDLMVRGRSNIMRNLYHTTNAPDCSVVLAEQLDIRHSRHGNLGKAIYCTQSPAKANLYWRTRTDIVHTDPRIPPGYRHTLRVTANAGLVRSFSENERDLGRTREPEGFDSSSGVFTLPTADPSAPKYTEMAIFNSRRTIITHLIYYAYAPPAANPGVPATAFPMPASHAQPLLSLPPVSGPPRHTRAAAPSFVQKHTNMIRPRLAPPPLCTTTIPVQTPKKKVPLFSKEDKRRFDTPYYKMLGEWHDWTTAADAQHAARLAEFQGQTVQHMQKKIEYNKNMKKTLQDMVHALKKSMGKGAPSTETAHTEKRGREDEEEDEDEEGGPTKQCRLQVGVEETTTEK